MRIPPPTKIAPNGRIHPYLRRSFWARERGSTFFERRVGLAALVLGIPILFGVAGPLR
jgi:hypothetical protein